MCAGGGGGWEAGGVGVKEGGGLEERGTGARFCRWVCQLADGSIRLCLRFPHQPADETSLVRCVARARLAYTSVCEFVCCIPLLAR